MTNILDRLESKDFILRIRNTQDKRKIGLYLTEKGSLLLLNAPQPLQENFIDNFAHLARWEQSQLLSAVERLAEMMNANEIDATPLLVLNTINASTINRAGADDLKD